MNIKLKGGVVIKEIGGKISLLDFFSLLFQNETFHYCLVHCLTIFSTDLCPNESYKKRKNNGNLNQKEHKAIKVSDTKC